MEASVFCQSLDRIVAAEWSGTASELLALLRRDEIAGKNDLPKTPQAVGSALKRASPSPRLRGWKVTQAKSGPRRRWTLAKPAGDDVKGNYKNQPSQPSHNWDTWDTWDTWDGSGPIVPLSSPAPGTAAEFEAEWVEDNDPAERWWGDDGGEP